MGPLSVTEQAPLGHHREPGKPQATGAAPVRCAVRGTGGHGRGGARGLPQASPVAEPPEGIRCQGQTHPRGCPETCFRV